MRMIVSVLALAVLPTAVIQGARRERRKLSHSRRKEAPSCAESSNIFGKKSKGTSISYNDEATPYVYFGVGNSNGLFACARDEEDLGIELCIRAKVRYPVPNDLDDMVACGDGRYVMPQGSLFDVVDQVGTVTSPLDDSLPICQTISATTGLQNNFLCSVTPQWSFDWHVNTNLLNSDAGATLSDFELEIGMDADPSCDTEFEKIFPLTGTPATPVWDHAVCDTTTTDCTTGVNLGGDVPDPCYLLQTAECPNYETFLQGYNVAQNSYQFSFYNNAESVLRAFDPAIEGNYEIYLYAKEKDSRRNIAVTINVVVSDSLDCDQVMAAS